MRVTVLSGVLLLSAVASARQTPSPEFPLPDGKVQVSSKVVLTGNPAPGERGEDTGVTYTAQPPFSNPADPGNKRLLDGDKPNPDWNVVAGTNAAQQTVTFDFKESYDLTEVALHFRRPAKPASVAVSVSENNSGPWSNLGMLRLTEQTEDWWRLTKSAKARFMKLDFQINSWGWYLDEVKVSGRAKVPVIEPKHSNGQLVLAENGRPRAVIVVADRAYPSTLRAANLFQSLTRQMTGVSLPVEPESQWSGKGTAVLIGESLLAQRHGVKVPQSPVGDDGYVIRGGGKSRFLILAGNDAPYGQTSAANSQQNFRGSLFAVYDFFERQGCGWFGPEDLWQVIPKQKSLTVGAVNVVEKPAFTWRRNWMHGLPVDAPLREAWRLGGLILSAGHNYSRLVPPEKYQAAHPDWFGANQPDITHPEVIRIAVESLSAELEKYPPNSFPSFSVSSNDSGGYREKPFRPEVGNIAAQQLYFANEVAKGLRQKHPGRLFNLSFLGYWHSHDGPIPILKAEPEVAIVMVNEGNHSKPLEWPESPETARRTGRNNTREIRALAQWQKTGGLKGIYEWWIPVIGNKLWLQSPWYDGKTTVANLKFWHRQGIRFMDYESQQEAGAGFPLRWAQYYIGARAMWNPDIDPRNELRAACLKLFGDAADSMTEFYGLQEKAMRDTTEHVGNWGLPLPHLLYPVAIEDRGLSLLQKALAQAKDPLQQERIQVELAQWKALIQQNAKSRATQTRVFKVTVNGVAMNWTEQRINAATVRDLFDLSPNTVLEVMEIDGQNRNALDGDLYDLSSGVTFRAIVEPPR